jgi:hypothetical protein
MTREDAAPLLKHAFRPVALNDDVEPLRRIEEAEAKAKRK